MKANLSGVFNQIQRCNVLVIGDLMLDTYTFGKVGRISPEAPVPIMRVQKVEHKPGGAGNVALNLISLGTEVYLMGRIGDDSAGQQLLGTLKAENVNVEGIFSEASYSTPVKNRAIAENQQMIRIDYEEIVDIDDLLADKILQKFITLLPKVDIVAISDYGKGLLSKPLLKQVIDKCRAAGIPVIVDPKGTDFKKYSGATILKPNWGEAVAAVGLEAQASIDEVASAIHHITDIETLIITRSKEGISTFDKNGNRADYAVKVREVKDVTGAGDTVLAVLACLLGNGLSLEVAIPLSNTAAGIAVERLGCARITLGEMAYRSMQSDIENKVFDEQHLFALQEAVKGRHCVILAVSDKKGLSEPLFEAIEELSQIDNSLLLIYLKDNEPSKTFVKMLASLSEIDFIILKKESLKSFSKLLQPDRVYIFENSLKEYSLANLC